MLDLKRTKDKNGVFWFGIVFECFSGTIQTVSTKPSPREDKVDSG